MQTLLARKSVSMTELREPAKVFAQAGEQPVAIMNRNQVVGYFVPSAAVTLSALETVSSEELKMTLQKRRPAINNVLKYLEDK
ncbi:MAG TPA: prevent-host-death family protein [Thiolinea sp.]|nr:prevent-host-death family protein [Thiolinea sp.]